jgi:hypothetical protein
VPNTSYTDFDVLRTGTTEPLTVFVRDPKNDELTDVYATSTFQLINIETDTVEYSTTFTADGGTNIDHPATGTYQFDFDTNTYTAEYIASFRCVLEGEVVTYNVFIKSENAKMFAQAASLRVQVDKARKSISNDIENMDRAENEPAVKFFYGYSDAHLIYYLERGAQLINSVPPYTAFTPGTFPWNQYGMILTDGAVIAALESQGIFAIDTDYNYSLGGNSLVIDHFTKLNTYLSGLLTRFDKNVVRFKQQFRSRGVIMFQWMPGGVRAARQLSAMPSGFWSRLLSTSFV